MKTNRFIATLFLISVFVLPQTVAADAPHTVLERHTASVHNVAFSADGNMLASQSRDGTVNIWNPNTQQLLRTLNTKDSGGIAFSPDGNVLASGALTDKVVNLWNPNTTEHLNSFKGHESGVNQVVFSPDGSVLASGSWDGKVRLWHPETGELLRVLPTDKLSGLAFSADGSLLANGSWDGGLVKVWNPETGQLLHTLKPEVDEVFDVAFSPDGHILASAGWGGIDLWAADTGEHLLSFPREQGRFLLCVAFSPDGRLLACGKDNKTISLWDVDKGILLHTLRGHAGGGRNSDTAYVRDVAFSPDGRLLASAGGDKTVRLWEITPPEEILPPRFPVGLTGPNVKTWTEDFNDGTLDSWTKREHQRERVKWETKNGRLRVRTQPFSNGRLNVNNQLAHATNYTLDFTAFPINAVQLRVKLKVHSTDNANAGIYIGRRPDSLFDKQFQHAYLFANHTLGNPDSWDHSGAPQLELNLKEIDVVFDRGHFYLYSEGEFIVDFRASSMRRINYVGIAVFPKKSLDEAAVTLDYFEISGPSVSTVRIPKDEPDDTVEDKPIEIEGVWVEDFSDGKLDSWTEDEQPPEDKRDTWQAKNGLLDVWIQPFPHQALIQTYQLEFTGFPIKAEKLRVRVDVLEAHNANVGILIGQRDLNGFLYRRTYKILHKSIWGPIAFQGQNPEGRYENLKDIEIVFDNGHFELLSEGEHILEFDEPNLPFVDCLGIVAYTTEVPLAHFVMDNFIVSESTAPLPNSLNVRAKDKAAILWGELKQQ